jgi:hypothetical protein
MTSALKSIPAADGGLQTRKVEALKVATFSNTSGGNSVFKALTHPLAAEKAAALIQKLEVFGPVAVYDPNGSFAEFAALYDLSGVRITDIFVQNMAAIGRESGKLRARPVTEMTSAKVKTIFVAAYDVDRIKSQFAHLIPEDATLVSLDEMKLSEEFLTNKRNYLDPLNFATNFAFFREENGHHTRIVTANYWAGYNAKDTSLFFRLFDRDGKVLVEWREKLEPSVQTIVIDSQEVRKRFNLGAFHGTLFCHAIGVAGHDIVKYALDTYGDDETVLSCTHDSNSWPADLYAGLPAPREGEKVILWVENSNPCAIPANSIGLNLMGSEEISLYGESIAPFATAAIDVSELLPDAAWPQQLEVQAGRRFGRPRYEVISSTGRRRIAHANVERIDLQPDPAIPGLKTLMGKGYILPAPILPCSQFDNVILPTPMATCQDNLPISLLVYDTQGKELLNKPLGKIARGGAGDIRLNALLEMHGLKDVSGHAELVYEFQQGGVADGWLHGLFRYEDKATGHGAETSFGAHIFNTVLVYKNEPQSYAGKAPGLSTRLFLRLSDDPGCDAICHLIYPASTPWHEKSDTALVLYSAKGEEVAKKEIKIACSGSRLWSYHEMFDAGERAKAGKNAYIMIRDTTCRLFGYHGLKTGKAFSLDHMFGF